MKISENFFEMSVYFLIVHWYKLKFTEQEQIHDLFKPLMHTNLFFAVTSDNLALLWLDIAFFSRVIFCVSFHVQISEFSLYS